jgi:hypothetical protein
MNESFGSYDVTGLVAETATGRVFRARHRELDRDAAVKVLSAAVAGSPGVLEGLRAEAAVLAGLSHPHVVDLYEFVEDDGAAWLAEQWVDGASLSAVLAEHGPLSPEQAVGVVRGALMGLAHAHDRGVVHRDVSTGNVVADLAGTSMLVDFGLAAPVGAESDGAGRAVLGTPAYLSPEAARGERVGKTGDVYSAAAVLHELVTGRPVFGGSVAEMVRGHLDTPAPRLERVGADLADLVARALHKDPAARPADAAQFLVELEEAARRHFGAGWLSRASIAGLVVSVAGPAGVFGGAPGSVAAATGPVVFEAAGGSGASRVGRGARSGRSRLALATAAGVAAVVVTTVGVVAATTGGDDPQDGPEQDASGTTATDPSGSPGDGPTESQSPEVAPVLSLDLARVCPAVRDGEAAAVLGRAVTNSQDARPGGEITTQNPDGSIAATYPAGDGVLCYRGAQALTGSSGTTSWTVPREIFVDAERSTPRQWRSVANVPETCTESPRGVPQWGDLVLVFGCSGEPLPGGGPASRTFNLRALLGTTEIRCTVALPKPEAGGVEGRIRELCLDVVRRAAG